MRTRFGVVLSTVISVLMTLVILGCNNSPTGPPPDPAPTVAAAVGAPLVSGGGGEAEAKTPGDLRVRCRQDQVQCSSRSLWAVQHQDRPPRVGPELSASGHEASGRNPL